MTDDDIARDLAICEAATPGPCTIGGGLFSPRVYGASFRVAEFDHVRDAEFHAAARTGWPRALAALVEARREIDKANSQMDEINLRAQRDTNGLLNRIAALKAELAAEIERLRNRVNWRMRALAAEAELAAKASAGVDAAANRYVCKHAIEAMRWNDTDAEREVFAAWFESHDAVFETRGPIVSLPEGGTVEIGEWILWSDGEFIVMDDESFVEGYSKAPVAADLAERTRERDAARALLERATECIGCSPENSKAIDALRDECEAFLDAARKAAKL